MTQKIKGSPLFATPKSQKDLEKWIMSHNGSERAVAVVAAGMAWNLAVSLMAQG